VTLSLPSTSPQGGITALMGASSQGHPSVVRTLLQAGASVNSAAQVGALVVCEAHRKYQLTPHVAVGVYLVL